MTKRDEPVLDPRLNAYSADLADARLRGKVKAERFAEGTLKRVVAASAPLRRVPRSDASLNTELIRGEVVRVFADTPEGWSWVQNQTDSYVGFLPSEALGGLLPEPTDRVVALRTFVYPGPDMKLPLLAALSIGSTLALDGKAETRGTLYRLLAGGEGAVVASHVIPTTATHEPDFVAVAERFVNVPYLWGGRTSLGLDCSALVQVAMMAAGMPAPRDTDLQQATLGAPLEGGIEARLMRGDLVFWPGHVGILIDAEQIVHASGHHMTVVVERLADAVARIAATTGRPTSVRRPAEPGSTARA
jgi:cell wall-associated NlpC family hydrolase